MKATECLVVFVTAPSTDKAASLARTLVGERLAACVNLVERVRSIYRWEGEVQDDAEVLMVIKTRADAFERLKARVVELHEYRCPEVVALPIVRGSEAYLTWLADSVDGGAATTATS
jgi:periplasmic divalent cation tolerance protein